MKLLKKIWRHGFKESLHIASDKILYMISDCIYLIFRKFPVNQQLIVLESEGDCSDNSYALFRYMKNHNYLNKYKIVWLVDKPENYINGKSVCYVPKKWEQINLRRCWSLATCEFYIYDHNNVLDRHDSRNGQKYIFLTHGNGFKATSLNEEYTCNADEIYVTGDLFHMPIAKWSHCRIERIINMGYPRIDYFFEPVNEKQLAFKERFNFNQYKKVVLWMPTFRRSTTATLDEEYFQSSTGLPIIDSLEQLKVFDTFLNAHKTLCIIKIHHLQARNPIFKLNFTNILILFDEMIIDSGLQLYQMVMLTDLLITDYSSISVDYLLLNRPIIYTLDDLDEYSNSRGFSISNVKDYLVGYHVYNQTELQKAITEIVDLNMDKYKEKRQNYLPIMHEYPDGFASKRILDHLGIIV